MEFGNEANAWTGCRTATLGERRVGECRRQLTFPKQRRVGLSRHPVRHDPNQLDYRSFGSARRNLGGLAHRRELGLGTGDCGC